MLVREKDLELLRQTKKKDYEINFPPRVATSNEKLTARIPTDRVEELMDENIHVLLYELSTDLPDREITCSA